jgi:hypothetical protein
MKWHRADRRAPFGPKKLDIFGAQLAQPPPTCPSNESARIKNHYKQGRINHSWFYVQETAGDFNGL